MAMFDPEWPEFCHRLDILAGCSVRRLDVGRGLFRFLSDMSDSDLVKFLNNAGLWPLPAKGAIVLKRKQDIPPHPGPLAKRRREDLGVTLAMMAHKTGIPLPTLKRWESGRGRIFETGATSEADLLAPEARIDKYLEDGEESVRQTIQKLKEEQEKEEREAEQRALSKNNGRGGHGSTPSLPHWLRGKS